MSMNELFGTTSASVNFGARALPGTAELTTMANGLAHNITKAMEADIENYRERIQKSTIDGAELDRIVEELVGAYDASFLTTLEDTAVESILKSQQSKRSRAKSKQMTMENYQTLLSAAVAEHIIRKTTGRSKSSTGVGRAAGSVDYTIEQMEALAANQNMLRKEIRNIQSKKSIMKSKADFNELDERWIALCKAEQQLKDLRVTNTIEKIVEVDNTKWALADIFKDVDISKLKSAEAHEMLEEIKSLLGDHNPIVIDDEADASAE